MSQLQPSLSVFKQRNNFVLCVPSRAPSCPSFNPPEVFQAAMTSVPVHKCTPLQYLTCSPPPPHTQPPNLFLFASGRCPHLRAHAVALVERGKRVLITPYHTAGKRLRLFGGYQIPSERTDNLKLLIFYCVPSDAEALQGGQGDTGGMARWTHVNCCRRFVGMTSRSLFL